jgi:hypothetical protein
MQNTRIYIVQVLGILLLLCGYFLSDQPDSLSIMHFDPAAHSVITKTSRSTVNLLNEQTLTSSQSNNKHRTNVPKYISFELFLPHKSGYDFQPVMQVKHTCALPETYSYLFYEEINPPPPKVC